MLYNIFRVKGGTIMFDKIESKKGIAIFNKTLKKDSLKDKMIETASEYWTDRIKNSGLNQISYEMGNGNIVLSDKELNKFRKNFSSYISKVFPKKGNYVMIWTSDGEHFEQVGTDSYLKAIMKMSGLPMECLPSDVCMWIYPERIEVEADYDHIILFDESLNKVKKMD